MQTNPAVEQNKTLNGPFVREISWGLTRLVFEVAISAFSTGGYVTLDDLTDGTTNREDAEAA